jgi:hypothetical protein
MKVTNFIIASIAVALFACKKDPSVAPVKQRVCKLQLMETGDTNYIPFSNSNSFEYCDTKTEYVSKATRLSRSVKFDLSFEVNYYHQKSTIVEHYRIDSLGNYFVDNLFSSMAAPDTICLIKPTALAGDTIWKKKNGNYLYYVICIGKNESVTCRDVNVTGCYRTRNNLFSNGIEDWYFKKGFGPVIYRGYTRGDIVWE